MAEYGAFLSRNTQVVDRVPSILERHTDACHVHGTSDYSLHVTLAPADCISLRLSTMLNMQS